MYPVILWISRDDVPIQTAVATFGLPARVVHAGTDRRELDGSTHHLPGSVPEATVEVEDHTPIATLIFEAVTLRMIPGVEITGVHPILAIPVSSI